MSLARRSLLAMASAAALVPPAFARAVRDHAGRTIAIKDASRVLAVGGDVTEIVYALGAGDRLVGVDTTSLYPPEARGLPQVGYMRQLAAEGVLSLRPSIVIATTAAGPASTFDQLRDAGVTTVVLPESYDFASVLNKIETIGMALGREEAARALAAEKTAKMAAIEDRLRTVSGAAPRVLFVLAMGQGVPQAAGSRTAADGIMRLARASNAINQYQGYRPVTQEGAVAAAPDVIMVTSQTLDMLGGMDRLLTNEALAMTPAGKARRIFALDALMLRGFGPRTPDAAGRLAAVLYPSVDFASVQ
jgi:iron complex transport system substrate-binding protein